MSTLRFLTALIGAQALGDHLTAAVQALMDRENTPSSEAYQRITDAADAADPAVLAATRQTWVRRSEVAADEAPVRRLYILERTDTGIFVAYIDTDAWADGQDDGDACRLSDRDVHLNDHADGAEFSIELLYLYELEAWEPFEHLLPTTSATFSNVRPDEGRTS
ncbi:hypothetical protein [Streptomyces sp. NBC_01361]|uniref:hypothetical protein n=1 Tax=Streptomyces sp. NBC_01361 TaxID=2903838 RepID=UPI002E32CADC|nr:hypothetical protein [Streptomyces sp. NBC_01361]